MIRSVAAALACVAALGGAASAAAAQDARQDVAFVTDAGFAGTLMHWSGSVAVPRSWRALEDDADAMRWVVHRSRRCTVDVTLRFSGAVAPVGTARDRLGAVLPRGAATILAHGDAPQGAFRTLAPPSGPLLRGMLVFAARPPVVLAPGDGVWAQVALTARVRRGAACDRTATRRALARPARDLLHGARLQTATTFA